MTKDVAGQEFGSFVEDVAKVPATGNPKGASIVVPLLPLVENVIFPGTTYPLALQGEQAGSVVRAAHKTNGMVAFFMQKEASSKNPSLADIYPVGTLSRLVEIEWHGDTINVTAEGVEPVKTSGHLPVGAARHRPGGPDARHARKRAGA